ncbi:hypothetical protein ACFL6N_05875, partial [Thermodesulfobacteriota bacterium]
VAVMLINLGIWLRVLRWSRKAEKIEPQSAQRTQSFFCEKLTAESEKQKRLNHIGHRDHRGFIVKS